MGVYKLSANSVKNGRTVYGSMLAGNTAYTVPGEFQSIATVSVGSGGAASISFTSIPSTYSHLQIRHLVQDTRATFPIGEMLLRFNSDSSVNYAIHELWGNGSSVNAIGGTSGTEIRLGNGFIATNTAGSTTFSPGILDILDYANTNKNKVTRYLAGCDLNGTINGYGGRVGISSGLWLSTSAITSITLLPGGGQSDFRQYSHFALYGIKAAA